MGQNRREFLAALSALAPTALAANASKGLDVPRKRQTQSCSPLIAKWTNQILADTIKSLKPFTLTRIGSPSSDEPWFVAHVGAVQPWNCVDADAPEDLLDWCRWDGYEWHEAGRGCALMIQRCTQHGQFASAVAQSDACALMLIPEGVDCCIAEDKRTGLAVRGLRQHQALTGEILVRFDMLLRQKAGG